MDIRICLNVCGKACIEDGKVRTECLLVCNAYVLAMDPETDFRFTTLGDEPAFIERPDIAWWDEHAQQVKFHPKSCPFHFEHRMSGDDTQSSCV
jgi:hypothetical protein